MKVIICGSISAAEEIVRVQKQLEVQGHEVEIPEGVKHLHMRRLEGAASEKAAVKLYCLYPVPELAYTSEILAMQPQVLDGSVKQL